MALKRTTFTLETECDFAITGISCHLADYRFIHYLNKIKNFNFIRIGEFDFYTKSFAQPLRFPLFSFEDKENYTSYYVLSNRSEDGVMVNDWKMFDFLFVSKKLTDPEKIKTFISQIKKIQGVIVATSLQTDKKPEIENLFSDIELHILDFNKKTFSKTKSI